MRSERGGTRRMYAPVLLVGLLGAAGMAVGASRPWTSATSTQPGLPVIHASVSGADLAPLSAALGVVVLGAFGAVIATRGPLRRVLGAVIALACLVVAIGVVVPGSSTELITSGLSAKGWSGGGYQTTSEPWRWLVLVSSVAAAWAGVATARYGDRWAVMGSRYDAPGESRATAAKPAAELSETEVWQAIDHGHDPTQDA